MIVFNWLNVKKNKQTSDWIMYLESLSFTEFFYFFHWKLNYACHSMHEIEVRTKTRPWHEREAEQGGHFVLNRLLVQRWNYPIEIKDKVSNIPENDYLKSVLDLLEYLECV